MNLNKEKVEVMLARKCMTYKDLCNKSGVWYQTIWKSFNRKKDTQPYTVGLIARALGVDVEEIIEVGNP